MKQTKLNVRNLLMGSTRKTFLLLLLATFSVQFATVAQRGIIPQREIVGAEANSRINGAISIKEGIHSSFPAVVLMSPESTVEARAFVPWFKKAMRTPDQIDFLLLKQEKDNAGMTHDRYVQTFKNVPIDKAHFVVHSKEQRVISFIGTGVDVPIHLNATPNISEDRALKMATERIGAGQYKWESEFWMEDLRKRTKDPQATYFPKGELCWMVNDDNSTFRLAWRFDIASASPDKLQRIYIDASNGGTIQVLPMESNCNAASVNTVFNGVRSINTDKYTANDFRLRDDCQAAIFWIRDWGSATLAAAPTEIQNTTNTWTTTNERFGGTVLWLTERSYAYWLGTHGRNSYDNAGGDVTGYINAKFDCSPPAGCVSDFNASMSFSGGNMKVGAGSGFADGYGTVDIIGHEYAHAVTGATSGLVYANESGALNESFSDIFGEMNERFVFGSNDWLLGDERSSGYIRNMSNPNDKNDPDTYLGTNWFTGTGDNGGVHTNSGVQNFWFYLLVNGGSGTNDNNAAYSVSGIGFAKASAIAYQNMISLGPNATHNDARNGAILAATNLYGACSDEVKQTTNAWHAVGVGARFFEGIASVTSNYSGRHVSCFNACDGAATVIVTSGVLPTYSWSPGGATTQSISSLCPGVYTVTVKNAAGLGCTSVSSVTILNTPPLIIAPAATSNYNGYNISCNGEDDGTAAANASGGTPPYTYNWIPSGGTGASASGLSAGLYTVTVEDANGCATAGNVTITEPPALSTTAAPTTNYNGYNVSCNGGSDGAATATPVGGVPPYTYSWNPGGQTTKTATGLSAIMYTVTVTDDNGCVTSANTTLTEPTPLTIDAGANQTVYYGYPDSACATLTATGIGGGVPPYTLSWSSGGSLASINVCPITSTVYYVTVTDLNGCTMTDSVRVCVIDVRCGNNLDKVQLCHFTNSAKNPSNTLCVALPAAKNHISHGDQLAACGTIKTCNFGANMARMYKKTANEEGGFLTAFPNPFADYTTVRFQVPADQHASLKLFDIAGRTIQELYNENAKGNTIYDLRLDGADIPAGVYFLILETSAGGSYTSKLIITR